MIFIDTHTHLYSEEFDEDRTSVINSAISQGVDKFLLPNIDEDSIPGMLALQKSFPDHCYPMLGLHPCSVRSDYKAVLDNLKVEIAKNEIIAIGEIGIDLYWDKKYQREQIAAFETQIEWAKALSLPIVIHVREAFDEIFEVMDRLNDKTLTGVFHCFTGNIEQAEKIISYGGFKLGIGGVVTFKNAGLDKTLSNIDIEHLVLETDSPYLAPKPYRGKRNESGYIPIIGKKIAEIYNLELDEVAKVTTANALSVFKL